LLNELARLEERRQRHDDSHSAQRAREIVSQLERVYGGLDGDHAEDAMLPAPRARRTA
jgi:hypothetical protein